MTIKKQIKRINYLLNIFCWRIDKNGVKYRDEERIALKLIAVNKEIERLQDIIKSSYSFDAVLVEKRYSKLRNALSLKQELEIITRYIKEGIPPTITVPCTIQIVTFENTSVKLTLEEYKALKNKEESRSDVFFKCVEQLEKRYPNMLDESLNILDNCY